MTFDELKAEIFLITNRPDLVGETESAIKSATLKAHKSDFYSKDIHEQGVIFESSTFRQSLDYILLIPNFRAFKYFRRVEDENDDVGKFLAILSVDEILDSYGVNKNDIAYVAGRVLEIRSSVEFNTALLGAYVLPIVTPKEDYTSWVAEQYPFFIIHEAARRIFMSIGQLEESNAQRLLVGEEFITLRAGALSDVGS